MQGIKPALETLETLRKMEAAGIINGTGKNQAVQKKRAKPKNQSEINKFWDFVSSKDENTAELLLYGEISEYSWYEDDITPKAFNNDLAEIGMVDEITVRINSGGGDVFAAVAIYTRLKEHKANIAVKIDGWCASAATIIAMAGDTIEISAGGVFMVHDPLACLIGYYNAEELGRVAKELGTVKQSIVNCYMTVTDKPEDEIKKLMADETWLTGQEAVDAGFCTGVMFTDVETELEDMETVMVNSVSIGLGSFNTVPRKLLGCKTFNSGTKDITGSSTKNDKGVKETMTLEEFKEKYPSVADAFKNEILAGQGNAAGQGTDHTEAVNAERARIKGIDGCTLPGFEDLADKAKYENPVTAAEFAMQVIAEQKKQGSAFLNGRSQDIAGSGIQDIPPVSNQGGSGDSEDPFGDLIDQMYPGTK